MIQKEFERSLRISSKISSFDDVQKALQEVEEALNDLTISVSNKAETEISDEEGKTGDIQITQNKDKSYTFEIRTEEGWKTPVIGDSAVKFKSKPAFKDQDKSIDEIETNDTTTGDKLAEKTIYDEKADKFIIARADYDSGWQTWTLADYRNGDDNPLTLTHNLQAFPTNVKIFIAPGQATNAISWVTPVPAYLDKDHKHGICCKITTTQILLLAGRNDSVVSSDFASTSNEEVFDDGSIRVLIWK